jgi:hypothetical protein
VLQPDLRPLGIGEILDRAVTLFVRSFAVLILILALVAIPVAILQYAAQPSTAGVLADVQRALSLPPGHAAEQRAIFQQMAANNRIGGFGVLLILASAVLGALSNTACIIAVAQAYDRKLPSVRAVYGEAARRWFAQLVAGLVFMGLAFVLTFVLILLIFLVVLALAALGTVSRVAALIVGVPFAIIAVSILFGAIIVLYFAAQMTLVSIALEDPNPFRGIGHGLRRTLNRALVWRSALVGTIVLGVSLIGKVVLVTIGGTLTALTHLGALYPIVVVTGSVALDALITAFIVIYAVDVRVRREGYDIAIAAREAALS